MATKTPNYNLTKPDLTDYADIRVLNANMDIIDNKMKTIEKLAQGDIHTSDKQMIITHPLFGDNMADSGDCTFVGIDNHWFIIDSFTKSEANLNSILKCMEDNNIEKFEFGFVSHYHNDHIGNFVELIKQDKIAKMYLPDVVKTAVPNDDYTEVANSIKAECITNKVPVETIVPKTIIFNGARLTFYNCSDSDYEYYKVNNNTDYNNVSACLEIKYLNRCALFEGDCNYLAMEQNALRNPVNVDYLKSNHHGISYVPVSYRKVNPTDIVVTATKQVAVSNLWLQNYQPTFLQMGCNLYVLGDQIEPPKITYFEDGHVEYNKKLLRDGTAGQGSLDIYVDYNYNGELNTGDKHTPFKYFADAIRFAHNEKMAKVILNVAPGNYTRSRDVGNDPDGYFTLKNINNKLVIRKQGSDGTVNLPPLILEDCKHVQFDSITFLGTSARSDNRKLHIDSSHVVLNDCIIESIAHTDNKDSLTVCIQTYNAATVDLANVTFLNGWASILTSGGTVHLGGTTNHCSTSHAYVVKAGIILVETPFVEKNNVNKYSDSSAVEAGQVYFKAVNSTTNMPSELVPGTLIPAKNTDTPQITQFVQMKSTTLEDYVYSVVDITTVTTPVFTGQMGYNGEEVFFGVNNKWVRISNQEA